MNWIWWGEVEPEPSVRATQREMKVDSSTMPQKWKRPGVEGEAAWVDVGDKNEAGAALNPPVKGVTFSYYARKFPECPKPVTIDKNTRADLWVLDDVRAWDKTRPGPGDWGGVGVNRRWGNTRCDRHMIWFDPTASSDDKWKLLDIKREDPSTSSGWTEIAQFTSRPLAAARHTELCSTADNEQPAETTS